MRIFYLVLILQGLAGIFCNGSEAQLAYPSILADSGAIASKNDYLQTLSSLHDSINGPNIIIIVADDLGKNDINLYDSKGVNTPNINQLASEGAVFMEAYATSAVCNPSRAGLVTGRYQQRFGNERQIMSRYSRNKLEFLVFKHLIRTRPLQVIKPWYKLPADEIKKQGLPESEITLFELFHSIGYRTACIGKWHLGYNEPFLPQNRGIDKFFGFYEAFSLYAYPGSKGTVDYKHKGLVEKTIWKQARDGPSALLLDGIEIKDEGYLTFRIAEESCKIIRQKDNSPFLLYIPFSAPHTPFQVPQSYYDRFPEIKDKNKRVYHAMIAALDDAIGTIMNQVKESGIEEETLIFFCSDNGGATYTHATTNGDLKGGKMTPFEGGLNIPFVMKWKGKISPGIQYKKPVTLMDIFATSVAAQRISLPPEITFDGVDLLPFLSGENKQAPHEYLFWRADFTKTVRMDRWKLVINSRENILELYDLEADKQEQRNKYAEYPMITEHLLSRLAEWELELMPPLWPGVMEYEEKIDGVKMRFAF